MVHFNKARDYFNYVINHPDKKVIVYGAGHTARENFNYMGHVDYFCDQRAKEIRAVNGIACIQPEELLNIDGEMIILICIKRRDVVEEIKLLICELPISAEVFDYFENSSFSCFNTLTYAYHFEPKEKLRIHIVSENDGWILTKFATKLQEELSKLGQDADISTQEEPTADVNHYIHFERLKKIYNRFISVRTTMITHVDSILLRDMIQYQASNNVIGICMSSDTLGKLLSWGIPRDKLCYVNPAQDGDVLPNKIVIGITSQYYFDSERDNISLIQVCKQLDPNLFKWKIMGKGWEPTIDQLREEGFEVMYYSQFDLEKYRELVSSLDYWLSYGNIGNERGYLDSLAAGIKIIVCAANLGIEYQNGSTTFCRNIHELINTLKKIQNEKTEIMNAIKNWTWENYAKKHLEIWQYLTKSKSLKEIYAHQSEYMDGIFSLLVCDNRVL